MNKANFFGLFGLPVAFDIDKNALKSALLSPIKPAPTKLRLSIMPIKSYPMPTAELLICLSCLVRQ